jgi:hypothetical protein
MLLSCRDVRFINSEVIRVSCDAPREDADEPDIVGSFGFQADK